MRTNEGRLFQMVGAQHDNQVALVEGVRKAHYVETEYSKFILNMAELSDKL